MLHKSYIKFNDNYSIEIVEEYDKLLEINFVKMIKPKESISNSIYVQSIKKFLEIGVIDRVLSFEDENREKVYECLLETDLTTYKDIGIKTGLHHRAVARIVATNKFALLFPCHRVIMSSGKIGGFKWGIELKKELLKGVL